MSVELEPSSSLTVAQYLTRLLLVCGLSLPVKLAIKTPRVSTAVRTVTRALAGLLGTLGVGTLASGGLTRYDYQASSQRFHDIAKRQQDGDSVISL